MKKTPLKFRVYNESAAMRPFPSKINMKLSDKPAQTDAKRRCALKRTPLLSPPPPPTEQVFIWPCVCCAMCVCVCVYLLVRLYAHSQRTGAVVAAVVCLPLLSADSAHTQTHACTNTDRPIGRYVR